MKLEALTLHSPEIPPEIRQQDRSSWVTKLDNIDLEAETLLHYQIVRDYRDNLDLEAVEANKVSSVYNTLSAVLKDLTKIQVDLANAEKYKRLEAALVRTLKELPDNVIQKFYAHYEVNHREANQ